MVDTEHGYEHYEYKERIRKDECEECDGEGHIECDDCDGDGECANCGEGACPECGGEGHFDCHKCNGKGKIEMYIREFDTDKPLTVKKWVYPDKPARNQLTLMQCEEKEAIYNM